MDGPIRDRNRLTAELLAPCSPDRLFAEVRDLATYPQWLGIVERVVPDPDTPGVWSVDLRGRLGPLARSKRLRMEQVEEVAGRRVRFERRELDGRRHSAWVLEAEVDPESFPAGTGGSRLQMRLHYGGSFGGALLERMLTEEIDRSRPRLRDRLAA